MQNKGAIRLFAIAMALVCFYQLTFTWVTSKVRRDAAEYAQGDPKKEAAYLDSISSEVVYNFIGLRKYTFKDCQEREINLGLDLKGGMNVTLEVSVIDIIRAMSNYSKDTTFLRAINLAKEYQRDSQEDFLTLFGRAFETIDPNGRLAAIFSTIDLRDRISYNSTNDEVLALIREETEGAIDNSFNILRSRIDRFGVSQPNISRLETQGRILIELPGIKEPNRVRKLLEGTASLEFWETYENAEVYQYLLSANARIKEIEEATRKIAEKEETEEPQEETSLLAEELNIELASEDTAQKEISLLEQLEKDSPITDSLAVVPDQFLKDYPLFAVLTPHVSSDGKQLLSGSIIGLSHYRDTAKVNAYLKMDQVKAIFQRDLKFLWGVKPPKYDKSESYFELHAIKITSRDGRPPLDGDAITSARAEFGQRQASARVTMSMNSEGAKVWARMTKENANRHIAIILDDYVYSSPLNHGEIKGGSSEITGDFTIEEAQDLANVLKSGKLPAPARIIQEEIIGPSLGQEAIQAGFNSFLIAFIVVLCYMVFYYSRRAGLVADFALVANVYFIIGVLASLGAVLTLPGIAGIILTIGMSVDANVLIYERIREELQAGKGIKLAVADGYKNAYSAIIDANVTTLLTGIILYIFGTGPIKGFATTLVIGILTSLFAAIFLTRLIFLWCLKKNYKLTFSTKLTEGAFKNTKINFIKNRKTFYVISGLIILIGIVSLLSKGLNYGIDFKGGRTYIVRFKEPVSTGYVQELLSEAYGEPPSVIIFGEENQVRIMTKYRIDESEVAVDADIEAKLYEGLKPIIGDDVSFDTFINDYRQSSHKVGPTIADDIKKQAVVAIFFSLIVMFLYILIRFKNWQFGLGALAALIHDALLVLGIFSIFYGILPFSLEIDQAFIAAILTVVGYSVNDTVVVFDRIREFVGLYRKRERSEIINLALNSTLSRTFSTSLSTFFVLLSIFIFGGEVIRGFIFALLVGIVVGTYSSLFIATPVVFDTIRKSETTRVLKAKKRN